MKKFSKCLVLFFIAICLPLLISCNNNSASDNKKESYSITFDLNCDYGKLETPKLSDDIYLVEFDGFEFMRIDSHGVNILNKINKDTEICLTIYLSINSYDVDLNLNGQAVDYSLKEQDEYKIIELSFTMTENVLLYMNGYIEMMF